MYTPFDLAAEVVLTMIEAEIRDATPEDVRDWLADICRERGCTQMFADAERWLMRCASHVGCSQPS